MKYKNTNPRIRVVLRLLGVVVFKFFRYLLGLVCKLFRYLLGVVRRIPIVPLPHWARIKVFRYLIEHILKFLILLITHSSSSFGWFCFGCSGAGC